MLLLPSRRCRQRSRPYGPDFPVVTVRDSVRLHMRLVTEALGVRSVACVVGGSMGGMQALEWLCLGGALVRSAVVMSCGARHHATSAPRGHTGARFQLFL